MRSTRYSLTARGPLDLPFEPAADGSSSFENASG
jgi:hypothetical protein